MRLTPFMAIAGFAAVFSAGAAQALTFVDTGKAQADLSYNPSTSDLTVSLTNLVNDPPSAGQEISGIQIVFVGGVSGGELDSQSGKLIEWDSSKPLTWTYPGGSPDHWVSSLSSGDLHLTTLSGGQPRDLITGYGPSFNGNKSIYNFTPSILGKGTFVVDVLSSLPLKVQKIVFEYGTGPDTSDAVYCQKDGGCGVGVPEPATWVLMLVGVGGLGGALRRRRALMAANA